MDFKAKSILKVKDKEKGWISKEVIVDSVRAIRDIFAPEQDGVSQVNLSLNSKVYYSVRLMKDGVDAKVVDQDGDMQFMCSPILLVECDDTKPIDISSEMLKSMEDSIIFY